MAKAPDIEDVLAANLKSLREAKGLTQAGLAELASLSITSVYRFEAQERWPKPENIRALAKALDCDPSALFVSESLVVVPPRIKQLALDIVAECDRAARPK